MLDLKKLEIFENLKTDFNYTLYNTRLLLCDGVRAIADYG